ncbi:MAG: hypothetical protein ACP5L1_09550 [Caldivirga sp.]|uniref:hypothetical protein n=1 Tax=Caldivirga sp. TaxID=2080243 RepID=UPI003D10881F
MLNEVVLSIIGLAVTVVGMLGGSLYWLGGKFKDIDKRFEEVDRRFNEMDRKLTIFVNSARSATVAMNSAIIEFLGVKGLISPSEAAFLTNEVARISQSIRANPISKEEVEYIRAVFSKGDIDKISVEELERVAEIAKRWWYEDGSEIAYKLFIYTWMLRAYKLYGKRG